MTNVFTSIMSHIEVKLPLYTRGKAFKKMEHTKACRVQPGHVQQRSDAGGFVLPLVLILVAVVTFALLSLFTRTLELRERQALAFAEADLEALTKSSLALAYWVPNCKTVWGYRSDRVEGELDDRDAPHVYPISFPHDESNPAGAEPFVLDLSGIDRIELKVADGSDIPLDDFDLKLYYCWGENASASCVYDPSFNEPSAPTSDFIDLAALLRPSGSSSFSFELVKNSGPGEDFLSFYLEATNHKFILIDTPDGQRLEQVVPQRFSVVLETVFDPCAAYPGRGHTDARASLDDLTTINATINGKPPGIDRYTTVKAIDSFSVKVQEEPWKDMPSGVADCPGGICKTPAGEKMAIEAIKLRLNLPDLPLTPLPEGYHEVTRTYSLRRSFTTGSLADQDKVSDPADRLDCWIRLDFKDSQGHSGQACDW